MVAYMRSEDPEMMAEIKGVADVLGEFIFKNGQFINIIIGFDYKQL